jgi:hypothetical protein
VGLPAQVIKHKNKVMLHLLNLNHAEMSERKVLEVSVWRWWIRLPAGQLADLFLFHDVTGT